MRNLMFGVVLITTTLITATASAALIRAYSARDLQNALYSSSASSSSGEVMNYIRQTCRQRGGNSAMLGSSTARATAIVNQTCFSTSQCTGEVRAQSDTIIFQVSCNEL